jgi:hypothetical protein
MHWCTWKEVTEPTEKKAHNLRQTLEIFQKMGAKKDMEKIIAKRNYSQLGILVVFYSAAFLGCSVFMKYHAASIMPIRPMTPTSP